MKAEADKAPSIQEQAQNAAAKAKNAANKRTPEEPRGHRPGTVGVPVLVQTWCFISQ